MSEQRKSSGLLGAGITLPSHSPSSTFRMQPQHHEKRPLKSIFDIKFQDERSQRKKGVASLYVRAIESSSSIEREQRHHLLNSLQQQKSSRTQNNSYSSVNGNDQSIGDSIQSGRRSIYSLYSTIPKSSYFTDHEVSLFRVGEALVNLKLTDICLRRDEVFSTTEASAFFISELHIAITPAELRNFYERYPSRSGSPGVIDKSGLLGQAKAFYDKIQSQKMSRAATEAMHSNWLRGKQRYDARKLEIAAAKVSNLRGLSPLSEVRRKIAELQKSRERFRKKPVNHNADHHHKSLSGDLDDPNVFEMATADILVERKPPFRLERLESTIEFKALQSLDEADHEDLIPNSTFTVEIVPSTLPAKSSSPSRSPSAESVEISHAHVSTLVGEHEDEPHEHDDSSVRRRDSALDAFTMLEVRNILDALIKGMVA